MKMFSFLFGAMMMGAALGQAAMNINGTSTYENSSAFMDIVVKEAGLLNGKNSTFLGLDVKGNANLDSSKVKKETFVYGNFLANDTEFFQNVYVTSGKLVLDSCTLPALYVYDEDTIPEIELKGNTKINGPILFLTGKGTVYKSPGVQVDGKVTGGMVRERH